MARHPRQLSSAVQVPVRALKLGALISLGCVTMSQHGLAQGIPFFRGKQPQRQVAPYAIPGQYPMQPPATTGPPNWSAPGNMPTTQGFPSMQAPTGQRGPAAYPQTGAPQTMSFPPGSSPVPQGATQSMTTHGFPVQTQAAGPTSPQGIPGYGNEMAHPTPLEAARELERQGNMAGADAQYRALLSRYPHDRNLLISYARMKHRASDLHGSVQVYQHALQLFPNDPVILNDLGLCFARMGDLSNAATTLRASIGLRPDSQRYRNNLAIVLLEMDRLDEAQALLAEVHGDLLAKYNLSVMLDRRGKTAEAKQLLTQVVEANPSFGPAKSLLAQLDAPISRVASLPTTAAGTASGSTKAMSSDEAGNGSPLSLIEPQSAEIEPGAGQNVSAAVFLEHQNSPPDVDAYHIPGVGLESSR